MFVSQKLDASDEPGCEVESPIVDAGLDSSESTIDLARPRRRSSLGASINYKVLHSSNKAFIY